MGRKFELVTLHDLEIGDRVRVNGHDAKVQAIKTESANETESGFVPISVHCVIPNINPNSANIYLRQKTEQDYGKVSRIVVDDTPSDESSGELKNSTPPDQSQPGPINTGAPEIPETNVTEAGKENAPEQSDTQSGTDSETSSDAEKETENEKEKADPVNPLEGKTPETKPSGLTAALKNKR